MGMLDSFFSPGKAYKKAGKEAEKYYQQGQGYLSPYRQQGLDQYGRLNDATGALMDPTKLQSQWAESYEQSPYAKQMLEMNKGQGLDAASAMGLMGSSGAMQNIQQGAGNIVAQDRQNYMNDLMQKYMSGIGLGQNMYGIGAGAAGGMANNAMQHGQNMAGLKYGEQAASGNLFGNLLGGALNAGLNIKFPGAGSNKYF